MQSPIRTSEQEVAEDIFFGQVVIIWARWFLILAGAILTLWTSNDIAGLTVGIVPILALMAMNFFLHGRYVVERPANRLLIAIASALDLIIVSAIIRFWPGAIGFQSQYYVFYYPMLLAFAFVFPHRATLVYTLATLILYAAACVWADTNFLQLATNQEFFVQRLVTLATTGILATYYWRIQRDRRREAQRGTTAA